MVSTPFQSHWFCPNQTNLRSAQLSCFGRHHCERPSWHEARSTDPFAPMTVIGILTFNEEEPMARRPHRRPRASAKPKASGVTPIVISRPRGSVRTG